MPIKCYHCNQADLELKVIQLAGEVRGEQYVVEMMGLKCPTCGFQTIEGPAMPEYGRLLADAYRFAHGLLTSDDIRVRRQRRGMSQQAFAAFLGVGVASVKRWEMGKIQDERNDTLIREKTAEWMGDVMTYTLTTTVASSTMKSFGDGIMMCSIGTNERGGGPNEFVLAEQYFKNMAKEPLYCNGCKQTSWAIELPNHQTVPPYIAAFFDRRKEGRQHARSN